MTFLRKQKLNPNQGKRQRILTDPKFLVGVLLIVISIALTSLVVAKAKGGTNYYELTADVAAGQPIKPDQLRAVSARVESDAYVKVGDLPTDLVATRSLFKGELLPKNASLTIDATTRRQVVIKVSPSIPSSVRVGSAVEIWAVPQKTLHETQSKEVKVLSDEALIVGLPLEQNRLLNDRTQAVEVSVPESHLSVILESANNDFQLVVVPKG